MTDDARDETPATPPENNVPGPGDQGGAARSAGGDVEALRAERDDYLSRLQRVSADYMNYQKRVQREIAESRDYANAGMIKDLLPVLDDMERAMEAARRHDGANDALLSGMQLVHEKAIEALKRYGVTVIDAAKGRAFNPEQHRAIQQAPAVADCKAGTVVAELQRGYMLKGRVLRPASVVVAVACDDEEPGCEAEDD